MGIGRRYEGNTSQWTAFPYTAEPVRVLEDAKHCQPGDYPYRLSNHDEFFTRQSLPHIWIDQLCINQSDIQERADQVAIMDQIFSKAERTLVWLGEPGSELEPAWGDSISLSDLQAIMEASYWRRHWIVQEVLLSKSPLCLYGHHYIDAFPLLKSLLMYYDGLENLDRVCDLLGAKLSLGSYSTLQDLSAMSQYMDDIVTICQYSQCENPLDIIYGIQGTLHLLQRVAVDYTISPRDLFLLAAQKWFTLSSKESGLYWLGYLADGMSLLAPDRALEEVSGVNVMQKFDLFCAEHGLSGNKWDVMKELTEEQLRIFLDLYLLGPAP